MEIRKNKVLEIRAGAGAGAVYYKKITCWKIRAGARDGAGAGAAGPGPVITNSLYHSRLVFEL